MAAHEPARVDQLVDHLFRHTSAQLVATLTRIFGPAHIDTAEAVVQEAFVRALEVWPYQRVPANPVGWLMTVARNRGLDLMRRDARLRDRAPQMRAWYEQQAARGFEMRDPDQASLDDQLELMFLCCHPALSRRAQVCLTLKLACGFAVAEVAGALLADEAATRKVITRAKQRLREQAGQLVSGDDADHLERVDAVLEVLYALFNEGYAAHGQDTLMRTELSDEAIRLATLLQGARAASRRRSTVSALLALMLLQSARAAARVSAGDDLVLLASQDRALWDQGRIGEGLHYLARSAHGQRLSRYHLEARIAACHVTAPAGAAVDWSRIAELYRQLAALTASPVVALNHAVAVSMADGAAAGLRLAEPLAAERALDGYHLLPAALADMHRRLGHRQQALDYYRIALQQAPTAPERRFLGQRIAEFGDGDVPSVAPDSSLG